MQVSDSGHTASKFARYKPGRRFYVFLISLILATGFWLLNALNKTYTESIEISIKYINLPDNQAFSPVPHKSIKIEMSGDGYSLMQFKDVAENDTVIIDMALLEFEKIGSRKKAQIPTSVIISDLRGQISNNINVSRVNRDSIEIITERGITKELTIKPDFSLSLEKGMVLVKPIYVEPSFVTVRGPISVLNGMDEIPTDFVEIVPNSENQEIEVKLMYNSRMISPNQTSVLLKIEVEPLTEGEIELPVHISGLPKNKKLRLIPNTIKLKYTTGLSHYDFISAQLFDVVVNYEDVLKNPSKIPVSVRALPSYVNIIQMEPERVGYLKMEIKVE